MHLKNDFHVFIVILKSSTYISVYINFNFFKGIFNVYQGSHDSLKSSHNKTFHFLSIGRTNQEKGTIRLNDILTEKVICEERIHKGDASLLKVWCL